MIRHSSHLCSVVAVLSLWFMAVSCVTAPKKSGNDTGNNHDDATEERYAAPGPVDIDYPGADQFQHFDLGEHGLFRTPLLIWDTAETYVQWRNDDGDWVNVRGGRRYRPVYMFVDADDLVIIEQDYSPTSPPMQRRLAWQSGQLQVRQLPGGAEASKQVSRRYIMELIHGPLPEGVEVYTLEVEVEKIEDSD